MVTAASSLEAASGNERFNAEAAAWDSQPYVRESSQQAFHALVARFPALTNPPGPGGYDVLEIGCGTGLLSCLVAPYAKRVVAVDAAPGMIAVLATKLKDPATPQNIVPLAVLLQDPEDARLLPADDRDGRGARLKYDLITSHQVLHHIADLRAVLTTMLGCLKSGGRVALTDFEDYGPEAKRFHPHAKMAGVERHGIQVKTMEALMTDVGFIDVRVERAWAVDMPVESYDGEFGTAGRPRDPAGARLLQSFPYVVCIGQKK